MKYFYKRLFFFSEPSENKVESMVPLCPKHLSVYFLGTRTSSHTGMVQWSERIRKCTLIQCCDLFMAGNLRCHSRTTGGHIFLKKKRKKEILYCHHLSSPGHFVHHVCAYRRSLWLTWDSVSQCGDARISPLPLSGGGARSISYTLPLQTSSGITDCSRALLWRAVVWPRREDKWGLMILEEVPFKGVGYLPRCVR